MTTNRLKWFVVKTICEWLKITPQKAYYHDGVVCMQQIA